MKIAVINNFDSFVFNLVRYLKEEGCEVITFRNDQVHFESLATCDGILLSPGPGIPSEAGQMPEVIQRFAASKPMLGVCLGHQALAEHFGGKLTLAQIPMHGKPSRIQQSESSKIFQGLPRQFEVGRYHSWIVQHPIPDAFKITASYGKEIMAMEHKTRPIFGVQFHPESILTPNGRVMIRNFIQQIKLFEKTSV